MHERTRHRWLHAWADLVAGHPRLILTLALLAAGASVALAAARLHFEPDRNALIAPTLEFNRRYLDWIETFPGANDMYIVVDTHNAAGEPDERIAQRARALVQRLGEQLSRDPAIEHAVWGFARDQVHPRAMRLAPPAEFEARMQQLEQLRLLLESPSMDVFFQKLTERVYGDMAADRTTPRIAPEQLAFFTGLMNGLHRRLTTDAAEPVDLLAAIRQDAGDDWTYLATPNGRLLLIRVTPVPEADAMAPYDRAIRRVRAALDGQREAFADVAFGLTGIDVIESDETAAVERDTTYASIGAAAAIAVLLVLAFHSVRLPLIMMTALGVAIAWSFGFTTLAVGHLQVISVVFAVILLGLGVAFAIHLASRFERVRHDYPDDVHGLRAALGDTFATMGPGVITGAVTTAAAFATTLFTDFRGVAEMGLIAAVGVLLCLVAMFTVFAALLRLFKARHAHTVRMEDRFVHFYEDRWVRPFWRHPWITLAGAAAVFAASLGAIQHLRFDYNLLALLPHNLPSVQWQNRIVRDGEQSIYTGVSIVDSLEEAARLARRFRNLDTVESVGGIGILTPPDAPQRAHRVRTLRQQLERTRPTTPPRLPMPWLSQLAGLHMGLEGFLHNPEFEPLRPQLEQIRRAIGRVLDARDTLDRAPLEARLAALQHDFDRWQQQTRQLMQRTLDEAPVTVADLPPDLLRPYYVDPQHGPFALEIHPRLPPGVADPLDPRFLGRFVTSLEQVDPAVTGVIVQVYHSGDLILRAYIQAGAIALALVFALVWLDFRSIVDAAATLVPVAVGFAATFAVMVLAGLAINPANIIVLPLMFGIGVDDGVHILHRYRMDPHTGPLGLSGGTGKGIALTSYTTMIGFGSLIFASHRGIAGLGLVMTVGIGMTLLACWTIMPAWLELRRRLRPQPPAPEPAAW